MSRRVAVAVAVPFLPLLTYRVPDHAPTPAVGARVVVPLGQRTVTGCVLATTDGDGVGEAAAGLERDVPGTVRDLVETLDVDPYLPRDILSLALWVSDYYACGPGEAIATAMPPLAMAGRGGGGSAFKRVRRATLTDAGRDAGRGAAPPGLGPRQRAALRRLDDAPDGVALPVLAGERISADVIMRLARRGLVSVRSSEIERDPFAHQAGGRVTGGETDGARELTPEQRRVVEELSPLGADGAFHVALLHGVTGSGKTEVYLRLVRDVCARGRGALMLVPEIALTPAVASSFYASFGRRVAVQHSGLSSGERHDQWHRIRRGDIDIVVGTRSAVFAPLANLGLVIVDEEHDGSYKQEETPRYHARSVATVRAQRAGALVVLGSATPSLESYHHARTGRYRRVVMTERVHRRPLPEVEIVDMRAELAAEGPDVVLSRPLRAAVQATLARGEQVLVLLNRRGYATAMLCRECGRTFECPNCSVALTLHRAVDRARCHYCNYSMSRPSTCAHCAGPYVETVGVGTERVQREVTALFPTARVARLDRDTARRPAAAAALLARFRAGEIQVLVGTQMIAKGHDFPKVTLVGVVSADTGLTVADFRAAERTFQLLTQVAGRAGRGDRPGQAIIQSYYPEHYSIGYACRQAYEPFFEEELRFRRELHYPPTLSMVNIVVRGRSHDAAMTDARDLARRLRAAGAPFQVLGPAVAPVSKIRGRHRAQIFLKGGHRRAMRAVLAAALDARPALRRKVTVDVDPMSMM